MVENTEDEMYEYHMRHDRDGAEAGAQAMAKRLVGELMEQEMSLAGEGSEWYAAAWCEVCGVMASIMDIGGGWLADIQPQCKATTPEGWDICSDGKYVGQDSKEMFRWMERTAARLYAYGIMRCMGNAGEGYL